MNKIKIMTKNKKL